jgi:hypothetical protein
MLAVLFNKIEVFLCHENVRGTVDANKTIRNDHLGVFGIVGKGSEICSFLPLSSMANFSALAGGPTVVDWRI